MSDIFISYKREDQPIARQLADALESEGWSVWWDPELRTGEHFDEIIEAALQRSRCVIVLWSSRSLQSSYVRDEATYALEQKKLVPVAIEKVDLPFRFKRVHTLKLINWDGSRDTREFRKLIEDISVLFRGPAKQPASKGRSSITTEVGRDSLRSSYREHLIPLTIAAALLVTAILIFWRSQKEVLVPTPSEGSSESAAQKENLVLAPTTLISPKATDTAQANGQAVVESGSLIVSGSARDLYRVYDSSGQKQVASKFTGHSIDLLPGRYQIELNETRQNVTVQANRQAVVESGSLIVPGNARDLYRVYDSSGQKQVASKFTGHSIDLLPGTYYVELHQSRVPVQVRANEKTIL